MGVLHGAIAIVRVNGTPIGHMRNIRASENIGRGDVKGIGTILTQELPALTHAGTLSCDFYEVDFRQTGIPDAIKRGVQTNQDFEDNIVLDSTVGVQIDIFKKVSDIIDPNTRLMKAKVIPYASIRRCFIETDGFDISENAISGHNQSFRYLDPIIQPS